MKEDRFKELLRDKLDGVEVTPPADMWSRVEGSLAATGIGAGAQAGGKADGGQVVGTGQGQGVKIRMPHRRRMNWTYALGSIAACVLIVLIITNLEAVKEQEAGGPVLSGKADELPKTGDNTVVEKIIASGQDGQAAENMGVSVGRRIAAVNVAGNEPKNGTKYAEDYAGALPDKTVPAGDGESTAQDKMTIAAVSSGAGEGADGKDNATTPDNISGATAAQGDDNKTSDTKRIGGSDVYRPVDAEYSRRRRRATPVATSLYAANLGGSDSKQAGNGPVRLLSNSNMYNVLDTPVKDPELAGAVRQETVSLTDVKHKIPLSFGVNVGVEVLDRLTVESGISYTYMQSDWTEAGRQWEYDVKQKLHYIGIPLNVKYDIIDKNVFNVYVSVGGMIEKCVSGTQTRKAVSRTNTESLPDKVKIKPDGVQMSVGASAGIEFKLSKTVGLYAEPGVGYFFKNDQPASYRTEHPLGFTLKAGLRLNL